MSRLSKFSLLTAALLLPALAGADQFCPPDPMPRPHGKNCSANAPGQQSTGDPADLASGYAFSRDVDFTLQTTAGPLEFVRGFISSPSTWQTGWLDSQQAPEGTPKPYGSSPVGSYTLQTWHNFFSFVFLSRDAGLTVHDVDGAQYSFQFPAGCANGGGSCWLRNSDLSAALRDRLYWDQTLLKYTLYTEGKGIYEYSALYQTGNSQTFFLKKVYTPDRKLLATVNYAAPAGLTCRQGVASGTAPGVPYIANLTTADGQKVLFTWKSLPAAYDSTVQECVISQIAVVAGTSRVPLVTYTYSPVTAETSGLVAVAQYPNRYMHYTYSGAYYRGQGSGLFSSSKDEGLASQLNYRDGGWTVASLLDADNQGTPMSLSFLTPATPLAGECNPTTPYASSTVIASARRGDGTDRPPAFPGYVRTFVNIDNSTTTNGGNFHEPRPSYVTDACDNDVSSCSPGTVAYYWTCANGVTRPGFPYATQDKKGFFTDSSYTGPPDYVFNAGFYQLLEKVSVLSGATDTAGTGALQSTGYAYVYSDAGFPGSYTQLLDTETRKSVVTGANDDVTKYVYDMTTHRLAALFKAGWTQSFDGTSFSAAKVTVGTFYYTNHACLGDAPDGNQRTLEVHGPCLVNDVTATHCSGSATPYQDAIPITQYFYYGADGTANANRLSQVKRFTQAFADGPGQCGTAPVLATSYSAYDARGNPGAITDAASVTTTFTYEESRVSSSTTAGLKTTFAYQNGRLSSVAFPQGNYELSSYQGPAGNMGDKLQYKLKAASATGAGWTEKVTYRYWTDGTLKSESFWVPGATGDELRRVATYSADAQQRPTFRQYGDAPGSYTSNQFFDRNDNVAGVGLAYNVTPNNLTFCGGPSATSGPGLDKPQSTLCAALGYDRVNNLVSLDEYPTPAATASRTCFSRDSNGNVTAMAAGLAPTTDCATLGPPSNTVSGYQYDDFGHVTQAALATSGGAVTNFAYDSSGNLLWKQTPAMRAASSALSWTYDSAGRRLLARHLLAGVAEVLSAFTYDAAPAPPGCPVAAHQAGRLASQTDSFGTTTFSYDAWGRPLEEERARADGGANPSCANGWANPRTSYAYTPNGDVASVTYPYGRQVTYLYGDGGFTDRVRAVSVSLFGAATPTATVVSNVAWEPYGGLRAYQLNSPTAPVSSAAVEYMLGDNASLAPALSCPTLPSAASSDHTGRLRALWVTSGPLSLAHGAGDIYKRGYAWRGDQVTQVDTCPLRATTPLEQAYAYDAQTRLTSATRPPGNFAAAGGAWAVRRYVYTGRGNRTSETREDATYNLTYAPAVDVLTGEVPTTAGTTSAQWQYTTSDGTATSKRWAPVAWSQSFTGSDVAGRGSTGSDSVYKSISVGGAVYGYYYDARNHRWAKSYPVAGVSDEYFYSTSDDMLVDQGNDSILSLTYHVDDDYLWLGGWPLSVVRGKLDSTWKRLPDFSTTCNRNVESASCDVSFPVTDFIGMPVLLLNSALKAADIADYEPFGRRNVVSALSPSESSCGTAPVTLATYTQAFGGSANPSTRADFRGVLNYVTAPGGTYSVRDTATNTLLHQWPLPGANIGHWKDPAWSSPSASLASTGTPKRTSSKIITASMTLKSAAT